MYSSGGPADSLACGRIIPASAPILTRPPLLSFLPRVLGELASAPSLHGHFPGETVSAARLRVQLPLIGGLAMMHVSRDSWGSAAPGGRGWVCGAQHESGVPYVLVEYWVLSTYISLIV